MLDPKAKWHLKSWKSFHAEQQPDWPDSDILKSSVERIAHLPALVFAGETRTLKDNLSAVENGEAFVLQAGDCAETFKTCHGPYIHDLLKIILQMSVILAYAGEKKIVTIGRMAGQYAKPRSSNVEIINGQKLPSYRGDMVNSFEGTLNERTPDPERMVEGYFCSAATLNLVRAFTKGGYAALNYVDSWTQASFGKFHSNKDYQKLCADIQKAVNFMNAIGIPSHIKQMKEFSMFTSHEALLLEYEQAMTRIDTTTGDIFDTSAHMLWIGERTRQLDGAHLEFVRGINNPIGVKIGPSCKPEEIVKIANIINPENLSGRLAFITRFGADKINETLPALLKMFKSSGIKASWLCDPMHGNTSTLDSGLKTRSLSNIASELRSFFDIHRSEGTVPGGVHLELSGENVTECTGGKYGATNETLDLNYQSSCDPRLNAGQAIELAFQIAESLNL